MDEFDDPTQSGVLYGDDDIQSTSETKFKNADTQDDDRLMSDIEASDSDGYYRDSELSDSSNDDDPEQSGGLYGWNDVQSTSQSKFKNAANQVDVTSQTDFEDDDPSMMVNVGSGAASDDSSQHSDFSQNSVNSNDEEFYNKLRDLYNFWHLKMVEKMKKWSDAKLKKVIPSVFYNLTLISRALSRDDILKSIMGTADHFGEMYCADSNYETLGRAVSKRQNANRDKLALSAKEPESDDNSDLEFDIWELTNDIMDNENVSGST